MIAQDVEDCDEAEVWLALPDIFDKPQDGGDGGGVGEVTLISVGGSGGVSLYTVACACAVGSRSSVLGSS